MWSPATRSATLAIACVAVAAVAAVQAANRIVQWRAAQQWREIAAKRRREKVRNAPRATLHEFRMVRPPAQTWVALCGTVFDVTGDPFFDARAGGIYASWVGHDVAALLVYGGVIDGRPANESEASLMDVEIAYAGVHGGGGDDDGGDVVRRRRRILEEWYARFRTRYGIVGQLSDLYTGDEWEALRDEITPASGDDVDDDDGKPRRRGKCPLGFGASAVEEEHVQLRDEDAGTVRAVRFQGRRYDVRGSALFDGAYAHFVGHDITYALATQSTDPQDLDVAPPREYSYDEQIRLEQYRRVFAKELRVISSSGDKSEATPSAQVATVDLHQLIDEDAATNDIRRTLNEVQAPLRDLLNAVCPRTTMTPLHKAVEKNRLDVVELLVRAGADVAASAALYDDETALQMAQRFQHDAIVRVLTANQTQ